MESDSLGSRRETITRKGATLLRYTSFPTFYISIYTIRDGEMGDGVNWFRFRVSCIESSGFSLKRKSEVN